jgi:hypothetical protein
MDNRSGKGLVIIHVCVRCGTARANRLAQDTAQADDIRAISNLLSQTIPLDTRLDQRAGPPRRLISSHRDSGRRAVKPPPSED